MQDLIRSSLTEYGVIPKTTPHCHSYSLFRWQGLFYRSLLRRLLPALRLSFKSRLQPFMLSPLQVLRQSLQVLRLSHLEPAYLSHRPLSHRGLDDEDRLSMDFPDSEASLIAKQAHSELLARIATFCSFERSDIED